MSLVEFAMQFEPYYTNKGDTEESLDEDDAEQSQHRRKLITLTDK